MNGHQFQLVSETNNPNQFDETYEAIRVYVLDNFKYAEDMRGYFSIPMCKPTIDLPDDTSATPTKQEISRHRKQMKECDRRCKTLQRNEKALYLLIMNSCSSKLQIRLRGRCNVLGEHQRANCIWLINSIRAIIPCFDPQIDIFVALIDAKKQLYRCRQGEFQSTENYLECFQGCVEVVEHCKGTVGEHYSYVPATNPDGVELSVEERTKIARERSMAVAFIHGADRTRFRRLLDNLQHENQPTDLKSAYEMLLNYNFRSNFDI
jgi:hypothetical protein